MATVEGEVELVLRRQESGRNRWRWSAPAEAGERSAETAEERGGEDDDHEAATKTHQSDENRPRKATPTVAEDWG